MSLDIKNTNELSFNKISCLIYGESGAGKTTLAATLPPKAIVVSLESGLLSLKGKNVDYVEVDPDKKITSLRRILGEIVKSDHDTIFIDSLTEIADAFLDLAKVEYPDARNTMQRFGLYNEYMKRFLQYTRDIDKNIFYSCLVKSSKDDIGRVDYRPSMTGSIADKARAYFDFVFPLWVVEKEEEKKRVIVTDSLNGWVAKDRSGKLDLYEKPDLGLIINKVFAPKGDS